VRPLRAHGERLRVLAFQKPLIEQQHQRSHSVYFFFAHRWSNKIAWSDIRDNGKPEIDWLIAGYDNGSKTTITVIAKGGGGVEACAAALPEMEPAFGGCRLSSGRFKCFYHVPEDMSAMKKGRAGMHKNGVLNVLEGCDGDMKMVPGVTEADL
jgi:hypothetical protein